MGFVEDTLAGPRPDALAALELPRRQHYHPSPENWQDEVVYFLLVDRVQRWCREHPTTARPGEVDRCPPETGER